MNTLRQQRDIQAKKALLGIVDGFYQQLDDQTIPTLVLPTRTKNNIEYNNESEVWVYGDKESERSAKTVKGAGRS